MKDEYGTDSGNYSESQSSLVKNEHDMGTKISTDQGKGGKFLWSKTECESFIAALEIYRNNYRKIAAYVGTKDYAACRNHARNL